MPMIALDAFHNADLTDTFVKAFQPKSLIIQELGLFTDIGSDTPIAAVDYYVEESDEITLPTDNQRYGTDTNSITLRKTKTIALEIPMIEGTAEIKPKDWQGKRSFGGTGEKTLEEAVFEAAQSLAADRDLWVEYKLTQALVTATQEAKETMNPNIDYQALFGNRFTSSNLDLSSTTFDVPAWIARTQSQAKRRARGLTIERIFAFCAPEVFYAIMSHPSIKEMMKYTVDPASSRNILTNYSTLGANSGLDAIQAFTFGGFTFVIVDDRFFGMMGENQVLIAPKFANGAQNPLKRYFTKASRDGIVAQQAPQTSYAYTTVSERNNLHLWTETSALAVNMLPSVFSMVDVNI
ncbi:major capsid protein [Pantoea dispersa]|uniref:major capsid protein n=1 Tax=Pantoea dispersa TaxID=59814 RepID=UPI003988BABA